tara:strand:- start:8902 stop:10881 length:1980 start_codon:yes stop_codon:yes gene_type:complete
MLKSLILFCILCFGTLPGNNLFGQSPIENQLDSIVNSEQSNYNKVLNLVKLAGKERYISPSKKIILKALEISKSDGNPLLMANSYYSLGNYYFFHAEMDSSLVALDLADENLRGQDDEMLKASILSTRGGIYSRLGDVILAITTNLRAKGILEGIDTQDLDSLGLIQLKGKIMVLDNSLANLYLKTDDYNSALKSYEEAYDLAIAINNQPNAAIILSNKGELLTKMRQYQKSLEISKQAKQMKIDAGLPPRFISTSNLNIGNAYYEMDSTQQAMDFYNEALKTSEENHYDRGIMMVLSKRGALYYEQGKVEDALKDCSTALELAKSINDIDTKIQAYECLYKVENSLGNYKASLENHEKFTQLKDSIFSEKNVRKMTQLGMQYEFDKKDAEQQLIIEKKNRQKNLMTAGAITLAAFLMLFYIFFRKRLKYQNTIAEQQQALKDQEIVKLQQENRLTAMNSMIEGQEKERTRIAKDLHDGLGSLLSSVKSHFTAMVDGTNANVEIVEKTQSLIDHACTEVRRISHNMMPHALSISGLEDGIKDIAERLTISGYEVSLEINDLPKMDSTKQVMVYRLVQEIVSNIKKHAEASSIFIQLYAHNDQVHLTIEDDGKGFDPEKIKDKKGLGLKNIESRVAYLNGEIDWDSEKGLGTTININFTS